MLCVQVACVSKGGVYILRVQVVFVVTGGEHMLCVQELCVCCVYRLCEQIQVVCVAQVVCVLGFHWKLWKINVLYFWKYYI